ncbi:MAG: Murein hydrolase activator EnvC [Legionellaceae bacterium]
MKRFKKHLLVFLVIQSCLRFGYAADTQESKTIELGKINQLIKSLRSALSEDHSKKSLVDKQLQQTQKNIQDISARLNDINQDIQKQEETYQILQKKQYQSEQSVKKQQDLLTEQIRITYKLLYQQKNHFLWQEKPQDIQRMLIYYRYISDARMFAMTNLNQSLQHVRASQITLKNEKKKLQAMLAQQQQQRMTLESTQSNKKALLHKLNSKIESQHQRLTQLLANKEALEKLIKRLQEQSRLNQSFFPQGGIPFINLSGKLPWPTKGMIVKRFGSAIDISGLKTNGVLLSAPIGQAVQAIYPGKVVFADWLQGFGKLIILDHGKGFMTLYGRNSRLVKKTDDIVSAGDLIANVGNNSGQEQAGLYFEIRHNGRPMNPENWCRWNLPKK